MKEFNNDSELIHAFLLGDLDDNQMAQVKLRIDRDQSFAEEIEIAQIADEAILNNRLLQVKTNLDAIMENIPFETKKPRKRIWILFAIAIIGMFAGLSFWLRSQPKQTTLPIKANQKETSSNAINPSVKNHTHVIHPSKKKTITFKRPKELSQRIHEAPKKSNKDLPKASNNNKIDSVITSTSDYLDTLITISADSTQLSHDTTELTVNCDDIIIQADVTTEGTCPDEENGQITVLTGSLEGGKAPYSFGLYELGNFNSSGSFNNMSVGYHEIYIQDNHGCVVVQDVYIEEKPCATSQIIAPDDGELWNIPNPDGESGLIILFDRSGRKVQEINLDGSTRQTWNGFDFNGNTVPMGEYSYLIKFDSGKVSSGSVSVVR